MVNGLITRNASLFTMPKTPTQETLTIEKLIHGGRGMGRLTDGRIVFADAVAPGDVITGELVAEKKLLKMPTYQLSTPSPNRQTPPCPHAQPAPDSACGGCNWQHLPIAQQHHWKTEIVRESMQRLGKIENPPIQPIQAHDEWGYRHTATWQVISHQGQPKLAYYARQSNTGMAFQTCPVLPETLFQTAELLNAMPALLKHCKTIKARTNTKGEVLLGITFTSQTVPDDIDADINNAITGPITGLWHLSDKPLLLAGQAYLTDTINERSFQFGINHFMQSHPAMVNTILAWLNNTITEELSTAQTVLDGYCGIGILGLSLLQSHHTLTGAEGHKAAVKAAKKNAKSQGVATQAFFHGQSMELFTIHCDSKFDLAICDPPRNGIKPAVLAWLSKSIRQTIVYISCDPATLARDSKVLIDAGWQLDTIQPFDMFPQTHHVETIAIFKRPKK